MNAPKTILIVDDDPAVRAVLKTRLNNSGFRTLEANEGLSVVALAQRERPDLILLDVVMPGQDGIEVYTALREASATKETPVIFLTALSQGLDPSKFLNPTTNYWVLGKPYRPEQLLQSIQQALGMPIVP